ncbi:MAG: hypothetical protein EOP06_26685 [Proteobacteria bacterium]|nr:MAG: hypothetical protein EOP06_26685 [Pseudomonadota bacterium]
MPQQSPVDLAAFSSSPLELLPVFTPMHGAPTSPGHQACVDANITPDQHAQITEAIYQSERSHVKLQSDLKVAIMDYVHTLMNTASVSTDAEANSALVADGVAKLVALKTTLTNNIVYTILKPEQRVNAVKCMMMMEREMAKEKLGKICKALPINPNN